MEHYEVHFKMALQKTKEVKGIDANYWKIINCDVKTGFVRLGLYFDKLAGLNRENYLDTLGKQVEFPADVSHPLEYAYMEIKKSKMETKIDPKTNEEITEETNWFADAEDVLEKGQVLPI